MLYYVNPHLFKVVRRPGIEGFKKVQVRTAMTNIRVCSILYDGEEINEHKLNIRSMATGGDQSVLIRSNARNNFDALVILAAIPFNGVILAGKEENYRYRKTFVVPVTEEMKVTQPCLYDYSHILYAIIEPNANVLFHETHAHHADAIYINIITKAIDKDGVSTSIGLRKGKNGQLEQMLKSTTWKVRDPKHTNPLYVPYQVFSMNSSTSKKPSPDKGKSYGAKNNNKPYNATKKPSNYTRPTTDNRNTYNKPKTPMKNMRDYDPLSAGSKYPAKSKKEINNRMNRNKTYTKK